MASTARRVPTVWELLSEAGAPVGVTGWWATWPADPVKGYMITDRVAYQLFGYSSDPRSAAGKAWPASVYDVVRPLIVPTDAIPWSDLTRYLTGTRQRPEEFNADERERLDEFRTLLAAGKTYLDVALAMRERVPVKFESVYFEGTDTVGHLFMSFRPPRLPSADPESFNSFQSIVDRYYEEADRMLGRLLEGRDGLDGHRRLRSRVRRRPDTAAHDRLAHRARRRGRLASKIRGLRHARTRREEGNAPRRSLDLRHRADHPRAVSSAGAPLMAGTRAGRSARAGPARLASRAVPRR